MSRRRVRGSAILAWAGIAILPWAAPAQTMSPVSDTFEGAAIDRTKWLDNDFARQVSGGKLVVSQLRTGGSQSNSLVPVAQGSVVSMQADVAVTQASITGSGNARARARLAG